MQRAETVDAYLAKTSGELRLILEKLRDLIRTTAPKATEAIKWGVPTYAEGKTGCYFTVVESGYVNFGFHRGAELPDPKGLLEGTGKGMRHIKLRSVEDIDAPAFRKLIKAAMALDATAKPGPAPATPRPKAAMPPFVKRALEERRLTDAYRARPPYQRNDYLEWITEAKREDTRLKRLEQMLDELDRGDVYMKMPWKAGK